MSDKRSWRDILDKFTDKARSEFEGERGEQLKQKLRGVRADIEQALEGEDAQRVKDRLKELGQQTEDAINRVVKSDAARDIVDSFEEVIENLSEEHEDIVGERADSEKPSEKGPTGYPP
ncbi:MAG TPA: hypothetical protein QGG37_11585 [Chloroflexota bacterium]|nr:hypothetical protein [Chloroflexota bacterium]|tara:strand:+ start:147 stop:503 length:357 start_codon:yes stop_codon:yes gene_type:complete